MKKIRDRLGQSLSNTKKVSVGEPMEAPETAAHEAEAGDPMEDSHETKGHMQTLMDAEQIKMDPVKMEKVHRLSGRHAKAIKSISDLKATYDKKFGLGALKK